MEIAWHLIGQNGSDTSNYIHSLIQDPGLILGNSLVFKGSTLFNLADTDNPIPINILSGVLIFTEN
jgi:hypothetical protein